MPQVADGREKANGIPDAYKATKTDIDLHAAAQKTVDAMKPDLSEFDIAKNQNRYVFVAAFDGTANDATQTLKERTNVHALYQDFDRFIHGNGPNEPGFSRMHARYIEGPGTQASTTQSLSDSANGTTVQDRVFEMYKELGEKTQQWKAQNPDAEISVVTYGFSRGAVEAAEFAAVLDKYGIQANVEYATQKDDDSRKNTQTWSEWRSGKQGTVQADTEFKNLSDQLVAPGKVPTVVGLFDPVATGIAADGHDRELPPSIKGALQITARDEHRVFFPVNNIVNAELIKSQENEITQPNRFANVMVAGSHSDIGGGYPDGKGLADSSKNIMGSYLNSVLGQDICQQVKIDPNTFVVHDSNTTAMQSASAASTTYKSADRMSSKPNFFAAAGVDDNLHGKSMVEMPSVNVAIQQARTADDQNMPQPSKIEPRLDAREPDRHTPTPPNAKYPLEPERQIDPTKLLLESSRIVSTLMDEKLSPESAAHLQKIASHPKFEKSIGDMGDSVSGRLSAAAALAAKNAGMDRIGEITFDEKWNKLVITDRHDTHSGLVKQTSVGIAEALNMPMQTTLMVLDKERFMLSKLNQDTKPEQGATQASDAKPDNKPKTLYDQAYVELQKTADVTKDPAALAEGARAIASQAKSNHLTSIDELRVVNHNGANTVVAVQSNGLMVEKVSEPVDAKAFMAQPQQQQALVAQTEEPKQSKPMQM